MLCNPRILGDPQQRGRKSEVATSPLPSWGPKRGRNCYATRAFSGVPEQGFKKGPHRASGKKPLMGLYPPPLAQARPRSQKSGQNGGSTPTPCLDKAVHARDTCDSHARNIIVCHG